ncbi:MAG: cation diffusion facilitator family transporter [Mycoplasmatales bacterium]
MKDNSITYNYHTKNILLAFILISIFTLIQFFGFFTTNSVVLYAGAIHATGDGIKLLSTYILEKLSLREANSTFTYGFRRLSLFAAIINIIILLLGSIEAYELAFNRLSNPEVIESNYVIIIALFGIFITLLSSYLLYNKKSIVSNVLSKGLFFDSLNNISILISSIIIFFTDIYIIDSLLAIVFATLMIISVSNNLKDIYYILMQAVPKDINIKGIKSIILNNKEVEEVHDLHIWTLDNEVYILTCHIVLKDSELSLINTNSLKDKIKEDLISYKIKHITFEMCNK